jgi:hypothetical protein
VLVPGRGDALFTRGHDDLTVLDVSARALDISRRRLGAQAQRVDWQVHDILEWTPARTFDVRHDRGVLHFLTTPDDVDLTRGQPDGTATNPGAGLGAFR